MADDSGAGIPAAIEAAWGLRERPGKGPKPVLSQSRVVDAAVAVAAADGLAAVSMSRIAGDLGVSTMSLYRYVSSKDELLTLMMEAAYASPPAAPAPGEGWRQGLERWARTELAALRRHPWVLRIPLSGPPLTPNALMWLERGLAVLRDTGLTASEKLSVILVLTGYVRNSAVQSADILEAAERSGSTGQEVMASYGRMLAKLIDGERFPELTGALFSGALGEDDEEEFGDYEFDFGLERVLDGVEALIRERG